MALVRSSRTEAPAAPTESTESCDYAALVGDLASPDAADRRRAARQLAAYPEAVPALCDRLVQERALSVRTVLFTTLIRLKSPAVVDALVPLLREEDAGLRNEAIEALQEMPEEVGPFIEALLRDPDSDVRILAIQVLSALPHPDAPRWLVGVIEEDTHVNVCAAAVDCLAEVGSQDAIVPLRALARRFAAYPFVTFAVDMAVRRIEGQ
jgi:HEAT repeat protein